MNSENLGADGYFFISFPMERVCRIRDPRGVFMTLLIGDSRCLLVDTGMGIGDVHKTITSITDKPFSVVNTHGHVDHVCGNYHFEEVWISPKEISTLRSSVLPHIKERLLSFEGPMPINFDADRFWAYNGDNLSPLEGGQSFDLGNLTVTAIPLPTHTRGSMGFLCSELKLLLTGDSISTITYLTFPDSCSVYDYIGFLESMKELPFNHILSAHEAQLIDKELLNVFIACGRAWDSSKTFRFRNPLFPEYKGKMYVYEDSRCPNGYTALICTDNKLETPPLID